MFCNQSYSPLLREGKTEDGPPYAPPGTWITYARHVSLAEAVTGMEHAFTISMGDTRQRDPDEYRIVQIDSLGRVIRVYAIDGTEQLATRSKTSERLAA